MSIEPSPQERARHLADLCSRDIICRGEVWGQLIEFVTPEDVQGCLSIFSEDLRLYFYHTSTEFAVNLCKTDAQRRGLQSLKDWYRKNPQP